VTFSGERYGYGNLVEVDHGDGLRTRYAHAKSLETKVGEVVQKGQVLALMGSTGRSTGPHVHFEVLQNGKSKNPETYNQPSQPLIFRLSPGCLAPMHSPVSVN